MICKSMVGKEVVIWPKRGEGFLICVEERGQISPATTMDNSNNQPSGFVVAPFVTGVVSLINSEPEAAYAIRYRSLDGKHYFMSLNDDAISSVTYADPSNPKPSSLIIGAA